ncbi:hypothetical protein [Bartonella raoultii]|uniref:hypothetical protein n=1 Tax=Bartonella raoultii TaxID=1457020 RepID=UPI001ABB8534|nr:hypothetical protein [Bartonella raoultii]
MKLSVENNLKIARAVPMKSPTDKEERTDTTFPKKAALKNTAAFSTFPKANPFCSST